MVCRTELVNAFSYDYCPDDLPPPADRIQSIMHGRFIDELNGNGITAQLTVSSQQEYLIPRSSVFSSVAGLVANPARHFPGLAANTVSLNMRVSCRRFLSQSFVGNLGPFNTGAGHAADFPDFFAPINLGDVGLHRQATTIKGRCVQNNGVSRTPLSNTSVELMGVWHQFPAADVDPLAVVEAPGIISLLHGLYRQRQAGAEQIRRRVLQPQIGDEKYLLLPAVAGATQVRISNQVNLTPGHILAIDIGHNDLVEYLEVVSINGASTDIQPATVTLAYPLIKSHRDGITVVRVDPQPAGTSNNLLRDAIPGDQTVFLDALTDLTEPTVEIFGAGTAEYHQMHLYSVVSDAEGYFSLPPISRISMMQLRASHAGLAQHVDTTFSPDYELFENHIDFVFS